MNSCLKKQESWLSGFLIVLILFVAGVQCCHLVLATPAYAATEHSQQSMNCHQEPKTQKSSQDSKSCHCETNPGQLAYFSDYKMPDFSFLLSFENSLISLSAVNHQSSFISEQPKQSRPPPLRLASHIQSTVLLI